MIVCCWRRRTPLFRLFELLFEGGVRAMLGLRGVSGPCWELLGQTTRGLVQSVVPVLYVSS
eukprot:SAG22_NODE_1702_length_3777_cov_30.547308_5_plen_61_part_00